MNKARRSRLDDVISQLNDILDEIYMISDEEKEAYDNLPESLQESERGNAMHECSDLIEDAASTLNDLIQDIEYITEEF